LFRYALNAEGYLFLGSSETIGERVDLYAVSDKKWKIFRARKLDSAITAPLDLRPAAPALFPAGKHEGFPKLKKAGEVSVGEMAERVLLDQYAPPCVIVNGKGDILYFHGRTGKYLEPAPGKAQMNVIEMAREGLRLDLRSSLRRAANTKDSVTVEDIHVRTNGGYQTINVTVTYIQKPEYLEGLLMIVFQALPVLKSRKTTEERKHPQEKIDQRSTELEFELKSTKERLQTTIEELETSNEELKSANEELQSANEELQSTNEELETSKEELQSVNEELVTVNAELQNKIDELTQLNNDMTNLLASTQIATIFLDSELRIKRFTPVMTSVINLIQTDVGRPISDIVSKLEYPELDKDAAEVIRTLATSEKVVQSRSGQWYLTRIMPYRTVANVIEGVVITFIDITDQHRTREEAFRLAAVCEASADAIIGLDIDGGIISWNRGAEKMFGYSLEEASGKTFFLLFPQDASEEIAGLVKRVKSGISVVEHTITGQKSTGTQASLALTLTPVRGERSAIIGFSAILRGK
ncbi:MAG TPA: PAS domain-containing protein, partial [Nitrospirota bacterium]|nr:PAS domain-containing protein [Nitrospirota bacterium]